MKKLYTKKAIKGLYGDKIISVGYCDLQRLLKYEDAFGYSAGVNGWDCDYYDTDDFNIIISTGYRPIKGIAADYDVIKKYESLAIEVVNMNLGFEVTKEKLNQLLKDFVNEVAKWKANIDFY